MLISNYWHLTTGRRMVGSEQIGDYTEIVQDS